MPDKPPFDPIKFACYIIAGVLGVECFIVLAAAVSCLIYSKTIISDVNIVCDPKDRMIALMNGALAAALALLAGFMGKPPGPPPDQRR